MQKGSDIQSVFAFAALVAPLVAVSVKGKMQMMGMSGD